MNIITKKYELGKVLFMVGIKHKSFGIGFDISSYGFALELGFVWLAMEW